MKKPRRQCHIKVKGCVKVHFKKRKTHFLGSYFELSILTAMTTIETKVMEIR